MKNIRLLLLTAAIVLSGCATSTFTSGRPFDATKVNAIQKGTTTKADVLAWFGQPYTKSMSGSNGEVWLYMSATGTSKARSLVFTVDVETTGNMKKLEVLFDGELVANHSFSEGGLPGTAISSSVGH